MINYYWFIYTIIIVCHYFLQLPEIKLFENTSCYIMVNHYYSHT